MKWEWFEYIPISNEGEEERRRKQGRSFLTSKLSLNRSQYQFRAKWQQEKMKTNVDSLPPGHMCLGLFRKNRPFYRYSGHIELIRFKEYYRMIGGRSTFHLYFRALLGTFFVKVFLE